MVVAGGVRARWSALVGATAEPALSAYYARAGSSGAPPWRYLLTHPVADLAALVALARLPRRAAALGDTAGGRAIRGALSRPAVLGTPQGWTGVAVLDVPQDPAAYALGASRATLRRKVRSATRQGTTWGAVEDPGQRRQLLALADAAEREHADDRYRVPRPDNDDLLEHDLWLVARSVDGVPLLLCVIPTDGRWALLRYFRTLGASPAHSDSRYLMCQVLVEALAARGVRHLADSTHPLWLPDGLRHFQRMVGFRLVRVVPSAR